MLQASLREYFLKRYKGGGVFEHNAYEQNADEWCWVHKRSGIKALPGQFDAFGGHSICSGCRLLPMLPMPSSSSWQVWQDALDLTQSGGTGEVECLFHYTSHLGFRNIAAESKKAVEVFVLHSVTNQDVILCHVFFCQLSLPTAANCLEHPKASLVTEGPKANAWWGQGKFSCLRAATIWQQLVYHQLKNVNRRVLKCFVFL